MSRVRITNRQAAERPAVPWEGTEHPGDKGDPKREEYEKGDPSAWAEDVRKPPYSNGERPAVPWEGSDHPAAKKEAALRLAVEKRAAKCIRLAQAMLKGKKVTAAQVEDQALDLMDLGDDRIEAAMARMEGGFVAEEEMPVEAEDEEQMLAKMLAEEEMPVEAEDDDGMMARKFAEMEGKITALEEKLAGQNEPDAFDTGFDVSQNPAMGAKRAQDEDEDDEVDGCQGCKKAEGEDLSIGHNVFDEYDFNGDGFITSEEWGGSPAVFAALDTDGDGIITVEEAAMGLGNSFSKFAKKAEDDEGEEEEEVEEPKEAKKAKKAEGEEEEVEEELKEAKKAYLKALKKAKKAEGEEEEEADEPKEAKKAKKAEGEEEEEVEEDAEVKEAKKAYLKALKKATRKLAKKAEGEEEEVEEEEDPKEAKKAGMDDADGEALIDALAQDESENDIDLSLGEDDPMGLDAGDEMDDDAAMATLYGLDKKAKKADDDEEEEGEEEETEEEPEEEETEEEDEGEKKEAHQKPVPKKASNGVKTLGQVSKTASGEMNQLEKLWDNAPDVSEYFK